MSPSFQENASVALRYALTVEGSNVSERTLWNISRIICELPPNTHNLITISTENDRVLLVWRYKRWNVTVDCKDDDIGVNWDQDSYSIYHVFEKEDHAEALSMIQRRLGDFTQYVLNEV